MNRESVWQEAYKWLCQQRKNAPADSDVWHLRFHWERDGDALRQRVEQGEYRLKPMRVVKRLSDDPIAMWDADDALVLKWVALQIQDVMPVHPKCHHVKGAGVQYSRREVKTALDSGEYKFVCRTDIRGYYQHMQKNQLNALVQKWVKEPILRDLVEQFIAYTVEYGGEFHTPVSGISRGCALSPLLGASLLFHVDEMFAEKTDLFYARYMDDFLVLSKKRWPLRRAIRMLNEQMNAGSFTLHPDKTQTGRVKKGFDWLGLWFGEEGIRRSPRSLQTRANKIFRLYEQQRVHAGTCFFAQTRRLTFAVATALSFTLAPAHGILIDLGEVNPYGNPPRTARAMLPTPIAASADTTFTVDTFGIGQLCTTNPRSDTREIATPGGLCFIMSAENSQGTPSVAISLRPGPNTSRDYPGISLNRIRLDDFGYAHGGFFTAGPREETVAIIHAFSGGVPQWSEPVRASYTVVQPPCDIPDKQINLGPFSDSDLRSHNKVFDIQLEVNCPVTDTYDLSFFFSSPSRAGGNLTDMNGGNVTMSLYSGNTNVFDIRGRNGLLRDGANHIPLQAVLSSRGNYPTVGPFQFVIDVDVVYH